MPTVGLEGELRVGLRVHAGRVDHVAITSTRPDVAASLLRGRSRAEVGAVVPLLFSVCGRSQAAASELACAAAAGEPLTAAATARCSAAVAAETVREGAWRTLLDWPQWLGEQPADAAVAAARAALALLPATSPADVAGRAAEAISIAAFGAPATEWLALQTPAELDRWANAGHTAAARFIRRLRDDEAEVPDATARTAAPLLGDTQHAALAGEMARALAADPTFERHPTWHGAPAETGALARLQSDPLLQALGASAGTRVPARFVARLRELALLLAGRCTPAVGAIGLPGGAGIGWAETSRGLLIHCVGLHQGRVGAYRIVAPTEWNFHPQGALLRALAGIPAVDRAAVQQRATRLVNSLDPCVACRVEFDDA